jgi:hypothetical protein
MFSLPIDDTSPIERWNTSQITSMRSLFSKYRNNVFGNCNPDISKWNVEKVVSFVSTSIIKHGILLVTLHSA